MKNALLLFLAAGFLSLPASATPPASSNQKSKISNPQSSISSSSATYTTTRYGLGTRTTDGKGNTWTATRYGHGTRTTGPAGSSYQTTRYGLGSRTTGTGAPPPVIPVLPKK